MRRIPIALILFAGVGLVETTRAQPPPGPQAQTVPVPVPVPVPGPGPVVKALPFAEAGKDAAPVTPPPLSGSRTVDPALVNVDRALTELLAGKPAPVHDIDAIFTIALNDRTAIATRIAGLEDERGQLAARQRALEARRVALPDEIPEPRLESTPPPEPPTAPARPDFADRPRRRWSAGQRRAWQAYEEELAQHETATRAHADVVRSHEAAIEEYAGAGLARQKKLAQAAADIDTELATAALRLRIATARQQYLKALAILLARLPPTGLRILGGIDAPRPALLDRSGALEAAAAELAGLGARCAEVEDVAGAGGLLGFAVEQEGLVARLAELQKALAIRRERLAGVASELRQLTEELAAAGAALRGSLLTSATSPERTERIDALFNVNLSELRRLRKVLADAALGHGPSPTAVTGALAQTFARPNEIGTVRAADAEIAGAAAALEQVDRLLAEAELDADGWRLAHEREANALLEALASDAARRQAYSLSTELLEDIQIEAGEASRRGLTWLEDRYRTSSELRAFLSRPDGRVGLMRLVGAVVLFAFLLYLRRYVPRLVSAGVRWLARQRALRGKVATIVRWAGLVQAVLPTLMLAVSGYAALALIGFASPEILFVEIVFRWLILYHLGAQTLIGITRQVSRGRPALLSVRAETVALLRSTYGRLGLFVAIAFIIGEQAHDSLGLGRLTTLIDLAILVWIAGWATWGAFAWRRTLAAALMSGNLPPTWRYHSGDWMEDHRWLGAALSGPALAWIVIARIWSAVATLLGQRGFFTYLEARSLRRLSQQAQADADGPGSAALPEAYTRQFPLHPLADESGAILVPREDQVKVYQEQLAHWRTSREDSSLLVLGEKGMGKTTLLALLSRATELPVCECTLGRKITSEEGLVTAMGRHLEQPGANLESLSRALNTGEERVVLLDEAHNVFLRAIDGFRGFDALVHLVNATSDRVFWVLVFNSFTWRFLSASRRRLDYFRRLLGLAGWKVTEIRDLIARRNAVTGFELEFDDALVQEERSVTDSFEVIEGADGYFRLLWETSGGNPRVATYLWLQSLSVLGPSKLRVRLFTAPSTEVVDDLSDDMLFALAAICQHENLSGEELRLVLNSDAGFAHFALRYLQEYGLIEPKPRDRTRFTLAPRYYLPTLKVLRAKHLLFEK